jgi:hypothetical protein
VSDGELWDKTAHGKGSRWLEAVKSTVGYDLVVLNRKPLLLQEGVIPIRIEVKRGKVLVLCPVNMLNKMPKRLSTWTQGDFLMENNFDNKNGCVHPRGTIYVF